MSTMSLTVRTPTGAGNTMTRADWLDALLATTVVLRGLGAGIIWGGFSPSISYPGAPAWCS